MERDQLFRWIQTYRRFMTHPAPQLRLNFRTRHGETLPRQRNELIPPPDSVFQRWQHLRPEWFAVGAADQQFHHGFILVHVGQRRRRNGFAKFLGHHFRIGVADAECNQCPDVSEHGLPDWFGKLVNVLVRQREAEPVFSRLRQNRGKRIRREILELVDEQVKIPALGFRRLARAIAPN